MQRCFLLREKRRKVIDDVKKSENAADDLASPCLPGRQRRSVGVHDFHLQRHLAERLSARAEHDRFVRDGDRGEGQECEVTLQGVRTEEREAHDREDEWDHENETVDELRAEAAADAREIERAAIDSRSHVEQLFCLACGAIRLFADVDETITAERRAAAGAAANALRHIDVVSAKHELPLIVWCLRMLSLREENGGEIAHQILAAHLLLFDGWF